MVTASYIMKVSLMHKKTCFCYGLKDVKNLPSKNRMGGLFDIYMMLKTSRFGLIDDTHVHSSKH